LVLADTFVIVRRLQTTGRTMCMKTFLLTLAALGFAVSSASACEYMRSAKAKQVDQTVVASIEAPQSTAADKSEKSEDVAK
jgi:hypothetical protein